VNVRDDSGKTPLHYASLDGNLDIVKYLVNKGADVNVRDDRGNIPLDYVKQKDLDIRKYLKKNGAKK